MILCQYLLTNLITSSHLQAQITAKNAVFTQELDLFEYGKLAISSFEIVQIIAADGNYSILDIQNVKTIIFNGNILCDAQLNSVITNQANSLQLGNFIINNPLKLLLQAQSSYSQVCQTNYYLLSGSCTSDCSSKFYDNQTWTCEESCSFYSIVSGKSYCVPSCPELTFQIVSGKKQCRSACSTSEFQFSSGGQAQCESSCTIIDPSYLYHSVDGSGNQLCQSTCSFKESLTAPIKCLQSCGSYPADANSVCMTSCSPGYLLSGSCTSDCSSKFYDNSTWTCEDSCSFYQIVSGKSYCVPSCPELTFQMVSGKNQCRSACSTSEFQFSSGGQAQCESSCITIIINPLFSFYSIINSMNVCQQFCDSLTVQPAVQRCDFCAYIVFEGNCVQNCPVNLGYDVFSSQCVNCTHVDGFCFMDCPVKINGICQEWKYEKVKGSEYVLLGGVVVLGVISVILTGTVVGKWWKARPIRMRATDMGAGI
ncbi:Conserved_hypothetical protein [Hexamita inflata]|uniref:Transmembrane protein n=1 Tax=Hexamita inflata TaxID=28002 RepID=A0AA86PUW5_9EUKA|nr:Conserved hypothetical protein [Hexamita inflata]